VSQDKPLPTLHFHSPRRSEADRHGYGFRCLELDNIHPWNHECANGAVGRLLRLQQCDRDVVHRDSSRGLPAQTSVVRMSVHDQVGAVPVHDFSEA
jgi:hypothetical protein